MSEVKDGRRRACRQRPRPRPRPTPAPVGVLGAAVLEQLRGVVERSKGNGETLNALIAGIGEFRTELARVADELGCLNQAVEGIKAPDQACAVALDPTGKVIELHGVRFSLALLELLSRGPVGTVLQILQNGGVCKVLELERPKARALSDVGRERIRQRTSEGCRPDNDDAYTKGELVEGAIAYVLCALNRDSGTFPIRAESWWPESWTRIPFKPKNRRRDLVRAAALLIAEIERIDRERERVPAVIRESIE